MNSFVDPPRLPTIDLSLFDLGDPWRDHVAAQVDWAASTFGLFQILGHGIDVGLIDTLLELGGKYVVQEEAGARRGEGALADLPGFRDAVREYITTMKGLSHKLMTTMARGLRLDDGFFVDRYTGNPMTALSIRDYPVALGDDAGRFDGDPIADRSLLTIVKLGESEGQQVKFDGQWIDVPALPSALLCNVGPVLAWLTDGHYVSAAHRLSGGNAGDPSLSFVFAPDTDAVLAPGAVMRARPLGQRSERYAFTARC